MEQKRKRGCGLTVGKKKKRTKGRGIKKNKGKKSQVRGGFLLRVGHLPREHFFQKVRVKKKRFRGKSRRKSVVKPRLW